MVALVAISAPGSPAAAADAQALPAPPLAGERHLAAGAVESFRLDLAPGEAIEIAIDQLVGDLRLTVGGEGDIDLTGPDDPLHQEIVLLASPRRTQRWLEIRAWSADRAARYRIVRIEHRPVTDRDRRRMAAFAEMRAAGALRRVGTPEALDAAGERLATAARTWSELGVPDWERHARRRQALVLTDRGRALRQARRLGEAEAAFAAADELWRELGDDESRARLWINRGFLAAASDPERALERFAYARRLLAGARGLTGRNALALRADLLAGVASALSVPDWPRRNPQLAGRLFRQAYGLRGKLGDLSGQIFALNGLGGLHLYGTDFAGARRAYEQVLALSRRARPDSVGTALYNLAWCALKERDLAAAGTLFADAAHAAERRGNAAFAVEARAGLARVERDRGHDEVAWRLLEPRLAAAEGVRQGIGDRESQALQLASERSHFEVAVDVLLDLDRQRPGRGYRERAFAVGEQARARWLLDVLPAADGEAEPAARRVTLAEARRDLLDGETLLLKIDLGDVHSHLWAITREGVRVHLLPPRPEVEEEARELYRSLAGGEPREQQRQVARAAARLGRLLLAPVAAELAGHRRLLIVPEGALAAVPFEVLPDPAAGGAPLLGSHEVSYAASASVAAWLARAPRRPPSQRVAVLYDPVFDPHDKRIRTHSVAPPAVETLPGGLLARLPATRDEAAALRRLLPAPLLVAAGNFAATKELVLGGALAGAGTVHLAAHGLFVAGRPERSGIVLSRFDAAGRPRDGLLTVPEIRRLYLTADLAVLSACQTGLGDEVRGEGPVGLAHAFFEAGVRRVLVSLWNVHDGATAALMARFYEELLKGHRSPAAALAEAKRALARNPRFAEPAFWAGFILEGPGDPGPAGAYTKSTAPGLAPQARPSPRRGKARRQAL